MRTPDDEAPGRTLLVALAAMAGVAVVVGLVVGLVVMVAVRVTGVGGTSDSAGQAPQSLYIPDYSPTKSSGDEGLDLPEVTPTRTKAAAAKPTPRAQQIKLFVAPQRVGPGERINFSGVYEAGEGVSLQIQRKENGSWGDFPVSATVRGGAFETWIETTHTGRRVPYRVYDSLTDRTSNVVFVTVG